MVDSREPIVVTLPCVLRRERAFLDRDSDFPSMLSKTNILHLFVGSLGTLNRFAIGFSERCKHKVFSKNEMTIQGDLLSHSIKAGCGLSFVLLRKYRIDLNLEIGSTRMRIVPSRHCGSFAELISDTSTKSATSLFRSKY